jgi:geranylgeranyl diphosphate synthase type I
VSMSEPIAGRDAVEILNKARDVVEPYLRDLPPPLEIVVGYHFGWCDEHGAPVSADGGKAVRSAFTLLAADAAGGDSLLAVDAAVAVELVHNFSLVHDDIIDRDTSRRRRATMCSAYRRRSPPVTPCPRWPSRSSRSNNPAAATALGELISAVQRMIGGQLADVAFESRVDVDVNECLAMAEDKTAALIECSCVLGALFGGADRASLAMLRLFGRHLGMAFQLTADVLGIWGDPGRTGKPVWSDLRSRKKSLPLGGGADRGHRGCQPLGGLVLLV